jgi:hypothetical protein
MSNTRPLLAVIAALVLVSGAAQAAEPESQQTILLDTIRANRKALVAVNLQLSEEEGGKFWPLYDKYEKELNAVGDRVLAIVEDYSKSFHDLSNDKAAKLMEDYLAAGGRARPGARTYLPEFLKILPGRTVARFYQIDNKMDAVLRYSYRPDPRRRGEARGEVTRIQLARSRTRVQS